MDLHSNLKTKVACSFSGQTVQLYDHGKRWYKNVMKEFFICERDFFHPKYNCDFTHFSESTECMRGDRLYERPKGWYRMALRVKGKYPDGDTWLGTDGWRSHSVPGEWPVSYHGTSLKGARGIIRSHYKAGNGDLLGRGIYSTPDIRVAERDDYAKPFVSKTTGKSYKVILQNRINLESDAHEKRWERSRYWIVPIDRRASAKKEKRVSEASIRPYAILIKEL